MTYEELQEYNKLSPEMKEDYNYYRSSKPNMTHKQILAKVAFDEKFRNMVEKGPKDPDPEDPEIMKMLLEGSKSLLLGLGIFIGGVFAAIDKAIGILDNLIDAGIEYIGNKLQQFWDWLTN